MSFVGPRPDVRLVMQINWLEKDTVLVLKVKPGITGTSSIEIS